MDQASGIYGPDLVSRLANPFGIEDAGQLRDRLVFFAAKYFEQKEILLKAPKVKLMRDEIKEIAKLADGLNLKLNSLSTAASELYWRPQCHILGELNPFSAGKTSIGHRIVRREHGAGRFSIEVLKEAQILEAIEVVGNLARHATDRLKISKGGAPSDLALQDWIINMQHFWELNLDKRFTYLAPHQGEGMTNAFLFCEAALQPIDTITHRALGTAMRKAIRQFGPFFRKAARLRSSQKPTPDSGEVLANDSS